jgi:Tol biopolymer transport system component
VTGDANGAGDVFVFERSSGTVRLVSATQAGASGGGVSYNPIFSPDGAWLVFGSLAYNLVPECSSARALLYAWHKSDGVLQRFEPESSDSSGRTRAISFSGNSGAVAFDFRRSGTVFTAIHDFEANQTVEYQVSGSSPALNKSRSQFVFLDRTSLKPQVYAVDRATLDATLASPAFRTSNPSDGVCSSPVITPDGRFVIFASQSSNLVQGDDNASSDIFVRDLQTGTTLLLTQSALSGKVGDALSGSPILGRDGRTVIFTNFASNLAERDFNQQADLFLLRLPGPESDFRVLSLMRLSSGAATLIWAAQPARPSASRHAVEPETRSNETGLPIGGGGAGSRSY